MRTRGITAMEKFLLQLEDVLQLRITEILNSSQQIDVLLAPNNDE